MSHPAVDSMRVSTGSTTTAAPNARDAVRRPRAPSTRATPTVVRQNTVAGLTGGSPGRRLTSTSTPAAQPTIRTTPTTTSTPPQTRAILAGASCRLSVAVAMPKYAHTIVGSPTAAPNSLRCRSFCGKLARMTPAPNSPLARSVARARAALDEVDPTTPSAALPHLRDAAEHVSAAIDEAMAAVILEEGATLRTAGALAGLSENAVGPRLARTRDLGRLLRRGRTGHRQGRRARPLRPRAAAATRRRSPPPLRASPHRLRFTRRRPT